MIITALITLGVFVYLVVGIVLVEPTAKWIGIGQVASTDAGLIVLFWGFGVVFLLFMGTLVLAVSLIGRLAQLVISLLRVC